MGQYDYREIEAKWQDRWKKDRTFYAERISNRPKYYVLDMFPYPSGAGLHVGHPLGYIATDIVARFKKHQGFNVLHPMGYDAFGLPAEQYAIDTGQHPAETTKKNVARYQQQLRRIGLALDPDTTDVKTCDPDYYRWTQWIFLQIFHSWYDRDADKARPIAELEAAFAASGSAGVNAAHSHEGAFSADDWNAMSEKQQQEVLLDYRLAYPAETLVNWCPALGTVLANDEVVNGVSERGGHPVERRPMAQWAFRMTAYADRLLAGLEQIDWPTPVKEMQTNWIGRSEGAKIVFALDGHDDTIEVFSTRPDTLFGSTFMVLAPEHDLVEKIVTDDRREAVMAYAERAMNRSEVERMQESKHVTGEFTGAYALHPFSGRKLPVYIADYVLAGYGTGAVMAVPAHDGRDYAFAKHFGIDIIEVVSGGDISEEAYEGKTGTLVNSDFLNGLDVKPAISRMIAELEARGIGEARINYRLRDPNFSRQRYWGEPFPIIYKEGVPYALDESELPVTLPEVQSYTPTGTGESPLAAIEDWVNTPEGRRETNTMPGYAGSSWYFFRYLTPFNKDRFVGSKEEKYWMNVDLYMGGSEHAVGHLLYSRFWTKVLFDLGHCSVDEPFRKLVNQGMIQGESKLAYRIRGTADQYISLDLLNESGTQNTHSEDILNKLIRELPDSLAEKGQPSGHDSKRFGPFEVDPVHVDVKYVDADILDTNGIRSWRQDFTSAQFYTGADGKFRVGDQVEKMSKRYHNVINPDDICDRYGADTFRMYEMFLGPIEDSKPFSMQGIEGVHRFLKKAWNLFLDEAGNVAVSDEAPTEDELRSLHQTIKKVGEDIERLSFNTCVSQFMIFLNEVGKGGAKRALMEPFLVLLSPFAPHFAEELYEKLGHTGGISAAAWPVWKEEYLRQNAYEYPVQLNGKVRAKISLPLDLSKEAVEKEILERDEVKRLLEDLTLRKVIVVPGRIINLVAN